MKAWIAEMTNSNNADSNTVLIAVCSSAESAIDLLCKTWPIKLNKESFVLDGDGMYIADEFNDPYYIRWEIRSEEMDTVLY